MAPMQTPVTGMQLAGLRGDSGGEYVGSPRTTDSLTKRYERQGMTVEEIAVAELPKVSNDRSETAFKLVDGREHLNGESKMSRRNAVFREPGSDVTVTLGSAFDGGGDLLKIEDRAGGSELRNVVIDASTDGRGVSVINSNRGLKARDVTVRGEMDGRGKWPAGGAYVTVPRGEVVELENFNLPDGASRTDGVSSAHDSIGVLLNGQSNGLLRMTNCQIGGMPNNGVYASGPYKKGNDGYAIIDGHVGYNSDRDQIRVGGPSRITDSKLFASRKKYGYSPLRGIWFRYARGARVENTTIRTHHSDPGAAIRLDSTAGAVTARNVDVRCRSDHRAARGVVCFRPKHVPDHVDKSLTVENSRFIGPGSPRDVILIKKGRGGSRIDDTEIDVDGAGESIDYRTY